MFTILRTFNLIFNDSQYYSIDFATNFLLQFIMLFIWKFFFSLKSNKLRDHYIFYKTQDIQ